MANAAPTNPEKKVKCEKCTGPDFTWDDTAKTLKDLISTSKLPLSVKLAKGSLEKYVPSASKCDASVLHLLEIRRRKVVVSNKMQWDRKTNDYVATGTQIDIPASYKGWFEILPEDSRPVEYFDTIQGITNVKPRRFLVRTSTVGYQLSMDNSITSWVPCEIRPGEILTTGIVYMDQNKKKSVSNVRSMFKKILKMGKTSKKEQDLKYLQCFDSGGKEIMIPLIMTGIFSPVGDSTEANYDAVYELQDLILAFKLPARAQLVHGESRTNVTGLVPHGVVKLESTRDEESIVVCRHPCNSDSATYEIPLDFKAEFFKDLSKRRRRKTKSESEDTSEPHVEEIRLSTSQTSLGLPTKAPNKEKKSRSNLFEKLSISSRKRKDRGSLKALSEDGIFSSRLSKIERNIDDYFENPEDISCNQNGSTTDLSTTQNESTSEEEQAKAAGSNTSTQYSLSEKRHSIQERLLPPVPTNNPQSPRSPRDGVYEELPLAPSPPRDNQGRKHRAHSEHDLEDDGYMIPLHARSPQGKQPDWVRRKPPSAPRALKLRKNVRSEHRDYNDDMLDELFLNGNSSDCSRDEYPTDKYSTGLPHEGRTHYGRPHSSNGRIFTDDSDIETRAPSSNTSGVLRYKSKSHKNLVSANATLRSHNVRNIRKAMDLFQMTDSPYSIEDKIDDIYNQRNVNHARDPSYSFSDSGYRRFGPGGRSMSVHALSDTYVTNGDDSAISLCSRGDYGSPDSEYSYTDYEGIDSGWSPPDDISGLTVQEVSKSLRYIGMKDRIVRRFANEQIDGNMLSSLDKDLLKEGFPEFNSLEIKKIADFVTGWRPRKEMAQPK